MHRSGRDQPMRLHYRGSARRMRVGADAEEEPSMMRSSYHAISVSSSSSKELSDCASFASFATGRRRRGDVLRCRRLPSKSGLLQASALP